MGRDCPPTAAAMPAVTGALPTWLNPGPDVQDPSAGGVWQYGFWDAKVRSNYTVSRCDEDCPRFG